MNSNQKSLKNFSIFFSVILILFSFLFEYETKYAKAEGSTVTKTITFSESTNQSQSKTISIPNLLNVQSASVDNGNVSYQVNGNNVTINVSNGTGVKVQTGGTYIPSDSKTVTDTRSTSPGGNPNSLPSSISYNSGGYTGTLTKTGSATVTSGSYIAPSSKSVTVSRSISYDSAWMCVSPSGVYNFWSASPTKSSDSSYNYNSGGYTGTLPLDTNSVSPAPNTKKPTGSCTPGQPKTVTYTASVKYSGTVTKPAVDTRVWTQTYSGTVTKPAQDSRTYTTYYSYVVTIVYNVWDLLISSVPSNMSLPSITLNGQRQQIQKATIDPLVIKDSGNAGWHITVSATQFSDDKGHLLPKNSLQMTLPNQIEVIDLENNQQSSMVLSATSFFIDGTSNTVFSINPTAQISQYTFNNFNFKLTLNPGNTYVNTTSGSSIYHSTITWTVVSGP